jgi:YgiT-type zinc finger domain-containing protein
MKCPVCEDKMIKGKTTITLDKGINETIVIKQVPGMICKQCGETFIDIQTTRHVEKLVKSVQKSGLKMGFLIYQPAA